MRNSFMAQMAIAARRHPELYLLTGDLGYSVVDEFRDEFPLQFVNCGVAEQLMISAAAGLSAVGKSVVAYSISNFATFRCLEQIRNDVSYHQHSVCIAAVGAGAMYGSLGYSHHGLEDLAAIRALPGMRVLSPADPEELTDCVNAFLEKPSPTYLRLGRFAGVSLGLPAQGDLAPRLVRPGDDITILTTGTIAQTVVEAAQVLSVDGVSAQVVSVPCLMPLDIEVILGVSASSPILTVEEHSVSGGLGSAVLEALSDRQVSRRVARHGFNHTSQLRVGSHQFMLTESRLDVQGIVSASRELLVQ
jgi:transketolase